MKWRERRKGGGVKECGPDGEIKKLLIIVNVALFFKYNYIE